MSTFYAPDQGTGPALTSPVTVLLESLARHRTGRVYTTPPTWFLLSLTGLAGVTTVAAWVIHSLALMLLALVYAVVAFAVDATAAIRARLATRGEES